MNAHAHKKDFLAKAELLGELVGFAVGGSVGLGQRSSSMNPENTQE
jgi:hypothetical protein